MRGFSNQHFTSLPAQAASSTCVSPNLYYSTNCSRSHAPKVVDVPAHLKNPLVKMPMVSGGFAQSPKIERGCLVSSQSGVFRYTRKKLDDVVNYPPVHHNRNPASPLFRQPKNLTGSGEAVFLSTGPIRRSWCIRLPELQPGKCCAAVEAIEAKPVLSSLRRQGYHQRSRIRHTCRSAAALQTTEVFIRHEAKPRAWQSPFVTSLTTSTLAPLTSSSGSAVFHRIAGGTPLRYSPSVALDRSVGQSSGMADASKFCVVLMPAHAKSAAARLKAESNMRGSPTSAAELFDQIFTKPDVARYYLDVFRSIYGDDRYKMLEPSAGDGAFLYCLSPGSVGIDIVSSNPNVIVSNFLDVSILCGQEIATIGNPPFGKNSNLAVATFNHAAKFSNVIGQILPRTFRKSSVQNRLDCNFHLVYEASVPDNAFLFEGGDKHVPTIFQIWERRPYQRELIKVELTHPDFEFIAVDRAKFNNPQLRDAYLADLAQSADFMVQRVGKDAGKIHHNFATASPNSHYFIRGKVQHVFEQLDFDSVRHNVAGNPSLAKAEIVALYKDYMAKHRAEKGFAYRLGEWFFARVCLTVIHLCAKML